MRILVTASKLILLLLAHSAAFAADESAMFEPGGLLFAIDNPPEGHSIFEQSLPDIALGHDNNVDFIAIEFNSLLRYGFTPDWEIQVGMAPLALTRIETPAGDSSETGYTDLRIGVKRTLSVTVGDALGGANVAVLGGITLPTGDNRFTANDEVIDLGVTALWAIGNGRSAGGLIQLTSGNQDSMLLVAAYGAPLSNTAGYYLEAGITTGDINGTVAGGGVTWMPLRNVELDTYLLAGISGDAPDMQASFVVSIYFE